MDNRVHKWIKDFPCQGVPFFSKGQQIIDLKPIYILFGMVHGFDSNNDGFDSNNDIRIF